jgi:hypothetical protein
MNVFVGWNNRIAGTALGSLFALSLLNGWQPVHADEPVQVPISQGRPAAPLAGDPERYYERRIVRRSLQPDPAQVDGNWKSLIAPGEPGGPAQIWAHWDDQWLMFAVAARRGDALALDLDLDGDGLEKGSANFRFGLLPDSQVPTLRRWESGANGAAGKWNDVERVEGATVVLRGETVCIVALRKSSSWDLPLRPGAPVGLRLHSAIPTASNPPEPGADLRVELADEIPAAAAGVTVRVSPRRREIVPGAKARLTVEIANVTTSRISLRSIQVGGTGSDGRHVPSASVPAFELEPGAKVRRDFDLSVADAIGIASFAVESIATMSDGRIVSALTSLDRIEPFAAELQWPSGAVPSSGDDRQRTKVALVVLRARSDAKADGTVELTVPAGWVVEGSSKRVIQMSFATEVKGAPFKVRVPLGTPSGVYPVSAVVNIAGRSYELRAQVTVAGGG